MHIERICLSYLLDLTTYHYDCADASTRVHYIHHTHHLIFTIGVKSFPISTAVLYIPTNHLTDFRWSQKLVQKGGWRVERLHILGIDGRCWGFSMRITITVIFIKWLCSDGYAVRMKTVVIIATNWFCSDGYNARRNSITITVINWLCSGGYAAWIIVIFIDWYQLNDGF